ncbi:MAG: WbqC family protein [Bacteroidota bacterium]
MSDKTALVELHYLPNINYFRLLRSFDHVMIEANESFQKQTFRNRCQILSAQGILDLSIPVKKSNSSVPIRSVEIENGQKWPKIHWRAIQSAYGKAPFWEYYADYFFDLMEGKNEGLFEFNYSLLTLCLKLLKLDLSLSYSKTYLSDPQEPIRDFREKIHPKKSNLLADNLEVYMYQQVFGSDFVENLSIIDLIFNQGPQSLDFIRPFDVEKINFETE